MSKHHDKPGGRAARILQEARNGAATFMSSFIGDAHEATWEPAVHGALHGDPWPAFEKLLNGEVPPPQTRIWLMKAIARSKQRCKRRAPMYWGPLAKRELRRTPRLRAIREYEQLIAQGLDSEEALTRAVERVNANPLHRPITLLDGRLRRKVRVSELRNEIRSGNIRRKLSPQ
jgi:hypothetical protein